MTCFQTGEVLEKNITFGGGGTQLFKTTVFKQVEVVGIDTSLAWILILLGKKTRSSTFAACPKLPQRTFSVIILFIKEVELAVVSPQLFSRVLFLVMMCLSKHA